MTRIIKLLICIVGGYLVGSLNPAALFSKLKKTDLRSNGTGNLGATNTMLVLGKKAGALVLLFDIGKAAICVTLANMFFKDIYIAGLITGCFTVIGHIFPFYMKFKGGKGFAPFAGLILAFDPLIFLILLVVCVALMILCNYSVGLTWSAAVLFPIFSTIKSHDPVTLILTFSISCLIMSKHFENLKKAIKGEDVKVRSTIKKMFSK